MDRSSGANQIAPPIKMARNVSPMTAATAQMPIEFAKNGTDTKNPLQMSEAKGVPVADHALLFRTRPLTRMPKATNNTATLSYQAFSWIVLSKNRANRGDDVVPDAPVFRPSDDLRKHDGIGLRDVIVLAFSDDGGHSGVLE